MSLDRVQVVKNFTSFLVVAQTLSSTPTSPYDAASAPKKDILDQMKRVGCIEIVIPAGQSVTVHDAHGGSYTVSNPATFPSMVHTVNLVNGHKQVRLSGTGTVGVVVFSD